MESMRRPRCSDRKSPAPPGLDRAPDRGDYLEIYPNTSWDRPNGLRVMAVNEVLKALSGPTLREILRLGSRGGRPISG
jgi:hypothetical protein